MPSPHNEHEPDLSRRTTPAESGPWSADKLAAAADETETRLHRYAVAGLLHRQPDGDFEPDSLHRLRLIQFAQSRGGITDEHLAAAITSQATCSAFFSTNSSPPPPMPRSASSTSPTTSVSTTPQSRT